MNIDPSTYKDKLLRVLKTPEAYKENINLSLLEKSEYLKQVTLNYDSGKESHDKAYFIGGGGVASWFLPQFIKTVFNFRKARNIPDTTTFTIYIYDNDIVEQKNLLRQNFIPEDVGKYKAQVLSERYNELYPGIKVLYINKYLYCQSFFTRLLGVEIPQECSDVDKYIRMNFNIFQAYVFNFVDNETTKHQLDYYLHYSDLNSGRIRGYYTYFCTGCDVYNGQVFTKKFPYSMSYSEYYKDISFNLGVESIETPISCAELSEVAALEQTFDSNTIAANLLNVLVNNTMNKFWNTHTQEIKFICSGSPKVESILNQDNYHFIEYVLR